MKNIMLISPNAVKARGDIDLNYDDQFLGSAIRTAQEVFLTDFIGKECVDALTDLVGRKINGQEDNIDSENRVAYKALLEDYLTPLLTYQVLLGTALRTSLKIRNLGVVRNSDTNSQYANLDDVKYLIDEYRTGVNAWQNRTVDFICANKGAIPECKIDCGCGPKTKYANTGLWLG